MPRTPTTRLVTVALATVTSLLSLFVGVGAFRWPPVMAIAGAPMPTPTAEAPGVSPPPPTPTTQPTTTRATPSVPQTTPNAPADTPTTAPAQQPRGSVRLPHGGTATLVREELAPGGVLPVPDDLSEATWWGAGLTARTGASVFAGHVNWRGQTGPFAELWQTAIGARVTVVDARGKRWTYRVSQVLTVHKDDLPARAEQLFGQDGAHRLVLVTCGGRWVGGSDGYSENRIVVADPA
ncbi:MAG: class F sortase [Haloechinothrix sp.]